MYLRIRKFKYNKIDQNIKVLRKFTKTFLKIQYTHHHFIPILL